MAEWRWQQGWTERELKERLRREAMGKPNFAPAEPATADHGWNHVFSQGRIARDTPGRPRRGGPFARARRLVARFEFSDPRIVVGHFDPDLPLEGRLLLLELKALGLRFLSPVRMVDVFEDEKDGCSRFGYTFETLEGHLERGRETFLVTHDHATGDVRFQVEAAWKEGDFPGWWARLGFALLGRRYQRAWHRLAHVRLRRLLALQAQESSPPHPLAHAGVPLESEPIRFYSRKALGARAAPVEREDEAPGKRRGLRILLAASALGAGAGAGLGRRAWRRS